MNRILFLIVATSLLLVGCESSNVKLLKSCQISKCKNYKTIEEMINDNMTNPSWEAIVATDGNHYVNITGIMPKIKNSMVTIQYRVYPEQKTAQFQAVERDGNKLDALFALGLLGTMCKN